MKTYQLTEQCPTSKCKHKKCECGDCTLYHLWRKNECMKINKDLTTCKCKLFKEKK